MSNNDADDFTDALFAIMDDQFAPERNVLHERDPRVFSTDPSIHVCSGMQCPHLCLSGDHTFVCQVTGACYGQRTCNDPFTAGIVSGVDENGIRMGKGQSGRWHRHDPAAARRAAISMAGILDHEEARQRSNAEATPEAGEATLEATMGEATPEAAEAPVAKASRRRHRSDETSIGPPRELGLEALAGLRREAEEILDKLTLPAKHLPNSREERLAKVRKIASPPQSAPASPNNGPIASDAVSDDSGAEMSPTKVIADTTRGYLRRCQISGSIPTLDELHNIELNARLERADAQQRSDAHIGALRRSERYVRLRALSASLVVSLWQATLRSPYMCSQRRATDSFRSYAAGVFLSMRRGVSCAGMQLVPVCTELSYALPAVRAAHRGTATHEVHLSAHKGVSCMQKCIASVRGTEPRVFFSDAIRASEALRDYAMAR